MDLRDDWDSEGLMVLTDNGSLQHKIASPEGKMSKTYWVQVEGAPTPDDLAPLARGVELKDGVTHLQLGSWAYLNMDCGHAHHPFGRVNRYPILG